VVWSCDLDQVAGWLSRIDGDLSKLSNSHLNAAKLIASRGIRVNADELPSILANVSGDLSRLSTEEISSLLSIKIFTSTFKVDHYVKISTKWSVDIDQYFRIKYRIDNQMFKG